MDEKRTTEKIEKIVRPTKKQRELLEFIGRFIEEHGYSPSYREIMRGCNYTSVATVALHVNSLIARGHLMKRGRSARSLELAEPVGEHKLITNQVKAGDEKWLVEKVEYFFAQAERSPSVNEAEIEQLNILVAALKALGLEGAAHSFSTRLTAVKSD